MPQYLQKEPKLKNIPSSVSLLHVLDFPPVSAGHSSKWLKYLNEKKSKCKTEVYRLNVRFIKTFIIRKTLKATFYMYLSLGTHLREI